jgi:hypothetical protein
MNNITQFIGKSQKRALIAAMQGEEGDYFRQKVRDMETRIAEMPETYGQSEVDDPTAYLHYFMGGMDFYITERDSDPDGEGQIQAFGYADLGYGGELGYISIAEITASGVEIDLYFSPKKLSEITKARAS